MSLEGQLTITGLDRLRARIESFGARSAEEMAQGLQEALLLLAGELGEYPAALPGTRYVRTGLLGRLWGAARPWVWRQGWRAQGGAMRGSIENWRPGIEYVQSRESQATVHRGRWRTAEEVIEEKAGEIDQILGRTGTRLVDWMAQ